MFVILEQKLYNLVVWSFKKKKRYFKSEFAHCQHSSHDYDGENEPSIINQTKRLATFIVGQDFLFLHSVIFA